MRIGIDATALIHKQPTGVERVTRELLEALLGQDRGNQYLLYTPEPLGSSWARFANVENRVLPARRWWTWRSLAPAISKDNLDLFWSPSNTLPTNLPAKSLATIHDLAFLHFPKSYSWATRLRSFLTVGRAVQTANKIITVSEQTKQDLIKKFSLSESKVEVIPNALPNMPVATPIPYILGDYILVVGRVEARKNPTTAIKAFALIANQYPKLQLIFVGSDGYKAEEAKALASQLGLANRIQFVGFAEEKVLANLYAHARVALFPSFYEGFGLPVLEAFHYGVPLVASNTPAVAEVAGDSALLVEPTDTVAMSHALTQLLEDPELRAKLIEKGAERLKQYSWEASAEKLIEVIKSI